MFTRKKMSESEVAGKGVEEDIMQQLWRLRYEDPTQYHTLVMMHLSFVTDLPAASHCQVDGRTGEGGNSGGGWRWQLTPLIKRLSRGSSSQASRGVMEGAPLTQEGVCQAFQLIHFLNKDYNIVQEGLFRKSGSVSRQQELKGLLNAGGDLNLDDGTYSPHDCASVLKSFLADLPEPLLTEAHYPIHCKIAEMLQSSLSEEQKVAVQSRQIKALRLLFLLLPAENYQLLHDLLELLHRVAAHQSHNLMSAINLGTMFAPHILCPRRMTPSDLQYQSGALSTAVAFMVEQMPHLFQVPLELQCDVRQYWSNKKLLHQHMSKGSLMDAPAKTIFTFIDRELTAQANERDVTEVALAELYAYVQALPDSAKKRKLIKQFNQASGSGTPQLNHSTSSNRKQEARARRLGESIKKHLFSKSVKPCKSKSQAVTEVLRVKRAHSEDLLTSPNNRLPELRMFRHNTELDYPTPMKSQSLDDLCSPLACQASLPSLVHPAFHPSSHLLKGRNFSSPDCWPKPCLPDSSPTTKPPSSPVTPLHSSSDFVEGENETLSKCNLLSNTFTECPKSECGSLGWERVDCPTQPDLHSPISQAVLRASLPQKVMLTPRSRCPIIFNSSSSLTTVPIPEEQSHQPSCPTSHEGPTTTPSALSSNLPAPSAALSCSPPSVLTVSPPLLSTSPRAKQSCSEEPAVVASQLGSNSSGPVVGEDGEKDGPEGTEAQDEDRKGREGGLSRWGSRSLRRTLSSATSSASLFGNFFRQLSTSSLAQLASRLTSTSNLHSPGRLEEGSGEDDCDGADHHPLDESLSSVFKDYLVGRGLLTDQPIDLSLHCCPDGPGQDHPPPPHTKETQGKQDPEEEELSDSAYEGSGPVSMPGSRQCSKASLVSVDSAVGLCSTRELSESLLYCLDGNNPFSECPSLTEDSSQLMPQQHSPNQNTGIPSCSPASPSTLENKENCPFRLQCSTPKDLKMQEKQACDLHTCSPESRRHSILKTRQGTPVMHNIPEHHSSSATTRGILFETSF